MKCHQQPCPFPAEFVKLGTDLASCATDLPDSEGRLALIEGDAEKCGDWTHIDGADLCPGCEKYQDESETKACESCLERACVDCLDADGVCQACRDVAAARESVRRER